MLILREADLVDLLTNLSISQTKHLLTTLHNALKEHSQLSPAQAAEKQPARTHLQTSSSTTLFMPATTTSTLGIKAVSLPTRGGPAHGTLTIFSPTGSPLALLNAEEITAFRTALVALLIYLRDFESCENIVIFGAGKIVEWHLRLVFLLCPERITSLTLVNRSLSGLQRLAPVISSLRKAHPKVEFELVAQDQEEEYDDLLKEVLEASNAVFCCTPSTAPLFPYSYLGSAKKRYISLIGSYKPHMQEIDAETLKSGRLVVDSRTACLQEAGELIMAGIKGEDVVELGQYERGEESSVVFKCVGMGIMDVAVGRELVELAAGKQLGIMIKDF